MGWLIHAFTYLLAVGAFVYLVGFSMNRYTFSTVDSGLQLPRWEALLRDVVLLLLFALPHSLLARRVVKRFRWQKTVYLFATATTLIVLFVKWEPIPNPVWFFRDAWWMDAIGWSGWLLALYAAAILNHAHTFGWSTKPARFAAPGPYRWVRHPQMIGVTLGLWGTREMTQGHLLFAAALTIYAWIGVWLEERDLKRDLGPGYLAWRKRTGALLPRRRLTLADGP
ncbi:MAG: hypothetical protein IT168_02275 [Bryobacterales bacterium]|nr:hypothetical protein [Bryobacterales bacterium]